MITVERIADGVRIGGAGGITVPAAELARLRRDLREAEREADREAVAAAWDAASAAEQQALADDLAAGGFAWDARALVSFAADWDAALGHPTAQDQEAA
jgi:hypothetical protein